MDNKICFKFTHEVVDNLNIGYNSANGMFVFWNRFQIFLFEEPDLESLRGLSQLRLIHDTESDVAKLLLTNHYLLFLDTEGKIYKYCLKLKQSAVKKPKISFTLLYNGVLCMDWSNEFLYTIQIKNKLVLSVHNLHNEVPVLRTFSSNTLQTPKNLNPQMCIFHCYEINEAVYNSVKIIFNEENNIWHDQILVIMSFDKLTLYGAVLDVKSEIFYITPIKLITCPSQVNDISFVNGNICLMIGLVIGTVIKLPLNNSFKSPNVEHLNTSLQKFVACHNDILYTDGMTMWRLITTSEKDRTIRQLFVRYVKDFIIIDNKAICITYSKLIYVFDLENESSYLPPVVSDEYCAAEHLLNNSMYLDRIMEEVDKNDDLIKKIVQEENYITTLALSNRHDILEDIIQYNVVIYENYQDVIKEDLVVNLSHNIEEYFDARSFYLLIKIAATSVPPSYRNILSNIFNDFKIHINILSDQKPSINVGVNIAEPLKTMNILVPFMMCNTKVVGIHIRLVTKMPGVLDDKQVLWTTLHSKHMRLMPEHFIRSDEMELENPGKIRSLSNKQDSTMHLIDKTACGHFEHLFKFSKVINSKESLIWTFYVSLPEGYKQLLINREIFRTYFNHTKAELMLKQLSSEEFLKSESNIFFNIANEKVDMKIINDGFSKPVLRVSCQNAHFAMSIRNFFSNLINNNFQNWHCDQKYLRPSLYSVVENTEKAVNKLSFGRASFEEFSKIFEQYQRNVIAELI